MRRDNSDAYVMRVNGSDVQRITTDPASDGNPDWGKKQGQADGEDRKGKQRGKNRHGDKGGKRR